MPRSSQKSQKKEKRNSEDDWAWEVLDGTADFIEANAGNAKAIEELIVKNAGKIIKAFIVLVRPEQRGKLVEWIDRVSKAIS